MTSQFTHFKSELTRHLDWFAERGQTVRFWWRDDDAVEPTDDLDRLLTIANRHGVDVALAVIPKDATEALADRLHGEPHAIILQHGYQHKNFQRKDLGEKAAELGSRRNAADLAAQIQKGRQRLESLFGPQFVPAMVPPWNRIAPGIARQLPDLGLSGLSTFTFIHFPRDERRQRQVQSHIDIIKWKKHRRFIGWDSARLRFDLQLCRRRTNAAEPLGVLSHHLAHDEGCYEFLDRFLEIAAHHPGARWPRVKDLFKI